MHAFGAFVLFILKQVGRLACIAAWISTAFTLLGSSANSNWLLALFLHFKIQYALFQSVALIFILATLVFHAIQKRVNAKATVKHGLTALVFLAGLLYNLQPLLPYYGDKPTVPTSKPVTPAIALMHINIFALNRRKDDVIASIQANQPDIIDFVEYTEDWQKQIETADFLKLYPYHVSGKAHVAIYSKFPIQSSSLFYSVPGRKLANHANLLIQLKIDNTPLSIVAVHPPVPASPKMAVENQASFKLWETQRVSYGKNLIIVGDFNNTPWTPSFQQLIKQTDLRDSAVGFGLQPTWPLFLAPLGVKSKMQNANGLLQQINLLFTSNLFRIPIDHALVSPDIQILSRSVGPSTGSDHLPLTIRFQIAK